MSTHKLIAVITARDGVTSIATDFKSKKAAEEALYKIKEAAAHVASVHGTVVPLYME